MLFHVLYTAQLKIKIYLVYFIINVDFSLDQYGFHNTVDCQIIRESQKR